ncbi:MFS transporter [Candidatus Dependentiae bacterium]|nr:MFS transporter [Candidatus Dependentiae bacterium]
MSYKKPHNKKIILVITSISAFLTPLIISSINIALPAISAEFNIDAILMNWIVTIYLIATSVLLLPVGRIGDIYGRKKIFVFGVIIYTLFSFFCGIANSIYFLLVYRLFQGIGAAMMFGTMSAILMSTFPAGERGKAIGINVGVVYFGLSIGPYIGGILTQHLGWRYIFLINAGCSLILLILSVLKLENDDIENNPEKFDTIGFIFYTIGLSFLLYGFSKLIELNGVIITGTGIVFLILFIRRGKKVEYPIFNFNLFMNNKIFVFSNLTAFINYSATYAVSFLVSLYLQYVKGYSPKTAGTILIFMPAMQFIISPFAGRLSDKTEPRLIASAGMFLSFAGLFLFSSISSYTSIATVSFYLTVIGTGIGLFSSPNTNAVMSSVDPKNYGVASGTVSAARMTGQMFSMGVVIIIFSIVIGKVKIEYSNITLFIKSIKIIFGIFAFLCFTGIFTSLIRGKIHL